MCASGSLSSRLAHIAKSAMYAPPGLDVCATRHGRLGRWFLVCDRAKGPGTKPECALESTVSQSTLLSRIGGGSDWVAHTWRCLPCVRLGASRRGPHTSQKARCVP